MADDSDDVVRARIALLDYHVKRGLLFPGMDERNSELHGLIDDLIAAVRAEKDGAVCALCGTLLERIVRAENTKCEQCGRDLAKPECHFCRVIADGQAPGNSYS